MKLSNTETNSCILETICSFEYRDKYGPGVNTDAPLPQTPIKVKYKLRYGLFLPFIVHMCRFPNKKNRQGKHMSTQSGCTKKVNSVHC